MIGVSNHLLSTVFRFHYHSQEVIGSLGFWFQYLHGTLYISVLLLGDRDDEIIHFAEGFNHALIPYF